MANPFANVKNYIKLHTIPECRWETKEVSRNHGFRRRHVNALEIPGCPTSPEVNGYEEFSRR